MSNEIKINHQESIKKRELTTEKKGLKFEILQNFERRENKAEEGQCFFFFFFPLKKGKLKLRRAKIYEILHIPQVEGRHVSNI